MHYIFQSSESVLIIFATLSYADQRMRESLKETSGKQGREVNSRRKDKKQLNYSVNEVESFSIYEREFFGRI